jgi:hypothetical protein
MGGTISALSEVHEQLKGRAKEVGLNICVKKKQKQWYKIGEQKHKY